MLELERVSDGGHVVGIAAADLDAVRAPARPRRSALMCPVVLVLVASAGSFWSGWIDGVPVPLTAAVLMLEIDVPLRAVLVEYSTEFT